jgi:hypothetical protein
MKEDEMNRTEGKRPTDLVRNRDQRRAVVSTAMNLRVA